MASSGGRVLDSWSSTQLPMSASRDAPLACRGAAPAIDPRAAITTTDVTPACHMPGFPQPIPGDYRLPVA